MIQRAVPILFLACIFLAGCYDNGPDRSAYVPKTFAVEKNRAAAEAMKVGKFEDALKAAQEAVETDPEYAEAALTHALALLRLNRLDEAVAAYDAVRKEWPDRGEAHVLAGIVQEKTGKLDEAKTCYADALAAYDRKVAGGDKTPETVLARALAVFLREGRSAGLLEMNNVLSDYKDYGPANDLKAKVADNDRAFVLNWMEQSK